MAKDATPKDLIGYEALQQEALRGLVRAVLARAADRGLMGEHHFYISFRTAAAGVSLADDLKARYPDEMTIVLQNQFWDLSAGDTAFAVTLQFGGQPKALTVPYAAISRFYDPSVQFLLQFNPDIPAPAGASRRVAEPPRLATQAPVAASGETAPGERPKIVSLDQFRKK